jgi:hypothetical protein
MILSQPSVNTYVGEIQMGIMLDKIVLNPDYPILHKDHISDKYKPASTSD